MSGPGEIKQKNLVDPVSGNEVPKVDDAIAVGEDLAFQERWWRFERITWSIFILLLIADCLGAFGQGWLAQRKIEQPQTGMSVQYDSIERTGTPSMMRVQFEPDAVKDGKVELFVNDAMVKGLGTQRVIPQPASSVIVEGGIIYTLPAKSRPGQVDFELEPGAPGMQWFTLQVQGMKAVSARVVVMP